MSVTEPVDAGAAPPPALVCIVSGQPSDEELAAVMAVLVAALPVASPAPEPPQARRSMWARPAPARRGRAHSWAESRLPH